jgi:Cu+-exporting ATPase
MTCASCVARVEKRLQRVDGVTAAVNLATESARVEYPADLAPARLVAAVREAGYDAVVRRAPETEPSDAGAHGPADGAALTTRLAVSSVLAAPVVALGWSPRGSSPDGSGCLSRWRLPSCCGAVALPPRDVRERPARAMTMDTLITLGTGAAYLWSVWALVFGSAGRIGMTHTGGMFEPVHDPSALVYFEVAAAVTVFLLLGRVIEERSKRRAGAAVRALSTSPLATSSSRTARAWEPSSCAWETASSCGPARRSPPTASSSRATRRSTRA